MEEYLPLSLALAPYSPRTRKKELILHMASKQNASALTRTIESPLTSEVLATWTYSL